MEILLLIFCCLCFRKISCQTETEIQKTFDLLEEGDRRIELTNRTEVILVFGATGCGKSTFIQWIAGDNTNLIAKETFTNSGKYLIEDTNDRIGSSTVSKTLFPELVTDLVTGEAFYDFPGFSDTRSPSHDIAASFFIKSVMDHVKNVKMLFLTSYFTVQKGVDRIGFPALLKNIVDMIEHVEKFKESIALVVTKVDNNYIKRGKNFVLESDEIVIKGIVEYLQNVQKVYEDDLKNLDINDKKRKFSTKVIKLINIFLTQENGEFTRIVLFRRPEEEGLLSESELLLEGKKIVQSMIAKNLHFSQSNTHDFGFTISDNSKLEINTLVTVINEKITRNVDEIAAETKNKLESFVEPVRIEISADDIGALSLTQSQDFSDQANLSQTVLSKAVNFFTHLIGINGIDKMLNEYLNELSVAVPPFLEDNMKRFSKYFEFFQLFNETPLKTSSLSWTKSFQSVLAYLTESRQFIKDKAVLKAEEINSRITFNVESIAKSLEAIFANNVAEMKSTIKTLLENDIRANPLDAKEFHEKNLSAEESLKKLVETVKNLAKPQKLAAEVSNTLHSLNLTLPFDFLLDISMSSERFEVLQVISSKDLSFSCDYWSNAFKAVVTFLQTQNVLTVASHAEQLTKTSIDSLLKTLTENIQSFLGKKTLEIGFEKAGDEIEKWVSGFSSIFNGFKPESKLEKLGNEIASNLLRYKSYDKTMRDLLLSLNNFKELLGFLAALQGKKADILVESEWKNSIGKLVEFLFREFDFTAFLMELFEGLSQFNVQNKIEKYDFPVLDANNFKSFLIKIKDLNINAEAKIRLIAPTASQISLLNNVVAITLKNRLVPMCPSEQKSNSVLQANFIKFSEFLDTNGKFKGCGWKNIKTLELHALNTLFIDRDLNALDEKLELKIVAPKWEVIGKREIILDGKNGTNQPNAANGDFPGGHGRDGFAGETGGSGGAFLGVVSSIVRSENLLISAKGGDGGNGGSGGQGANGKDGETPIKKDANLGQLNLKNYENKFRVRMNEKCRFVCTIIVYPQHCQTVCDCKNYVIYGTKGTSGGNAGSCGVGGKGGFSGQILVFNLNGTSKGWQKLGDGRHGNNGMLAMGGKGGKHGANNDVSCKRYYTYNDFYDDSNNIHAPDGLSNYECRNMPKNPPPARKVENASDSVRKFKEFVIKTSSYQLMKFSAFKFCEQLNKNAEIEKLRNTFELVEDSKMLERLARDKNLNLFPFYKLHLKNIENYASNPNGDEKSGEFKKILAYLYTVSLSQMANLKNNQDNDLIIDISEHLNIVRENIKTLSALQDESRLVSVVATLKNQFKKEVNAKTEEALSLIENVIAPEMDFVSSNFGAQLHNLVVEIDELQLAAVQETKTLERKKKELEQAMITSTILGVLGIFGKVASLFGEAGKAISVGIEVGTSVGSMLKQDSSISNVLSDETEKEVKKLQNIRNRADSLIDSADFGQNGLTEITKKIAAMKKVSKKLEELKKKVFNTLIPLIQEMNRFLSETAKSLELKSGVSLDVIDWQVQQKLRSILNEIQDFTREFECDKAVTSLVNQLEAAMKILIRVYDRIQDQQEQQRLATYLADLSSASARKIVVSNPKLDSSLRDLQISIRSNILLNQYNSVLNAFKQWVFPFAEYFLKDTTLTRYNYGTFFDVESLASNASSQIEAIQTQIKTYQSTITSIDRHIHTENFNQSSSFSNSFYVWKNEEYRDMITKLLAGETILAKADIRRSSTGKDAVKFNFIEVGFKSDNLSIQAEINENLLNYGINMTHLGNSNYRYKNQFFTIFSPSQSMHYSFQKNGNGVALSSNNVYKKLYAGDILLSPYTMWEMKLTLGDKTKSFASLSKFFDKVDLVLEGSGTYLSEGTHFDVAGYYKVDDSI